MNGARPTRKKKGESISSAFPGVVEVAVLGPRRSFVACSSSFAASFRVDPFVLPIPTKLLLLLSAAAAVSIAAAAAAVSIAAAAAVSIAAAAAVSIIAATVFS